MIEIKEKVIQYDLNAKLSEEEYSTLKTMFYHKYFQGRPSIELALKLLLKKDVMEMYCVREEYLNEIEIK